MSRLRTSILPVANRHGVVPAGHKPPFYGLDNGNPEQSQIAEYWTIIRRQIGLILLFTFAGLAVAASVALVATPVFRARTTVDIQPFNDDILKSRDSDTRSSGSNTLSESYVQTEIKLLQSGVVLNRVIRRLRREIPASFVVDTPALQRLLGLSPHQTRDGVIAITANTLKIRALIPSRIVEVLCEGPDPRVAAKFCNTLTEEYIAQNLEARSDTTQSTSKWLTEQLADLKQRLARSESDLQQTARESALVMTQDTDTLAQEKLRALQDQLERTSAERIGKQSQYELISGAPPEALTAILDSTALRDYEVKLTDLKRELAQLSTSLTPAHSRVQQVQSQIAVMQAAVERERSRVLTRMKSEFEDVQQREAQFQKAYNGQMELVSGQAAKGVQYNMLKREVDSERRLYESMLERVQELGLSAAMRASTIRIVDSAVVPVQAYSPKWKTNLAIGFFGGAFLGLMVAMIRSRSEGTLREPGDARMQLKVRELGVIPLDKPALSSMLFSRGRGLLRLVPGAHSNDGSGNDEAKFESPELVSLNRKNSIVAESYVSAMNSLLLAPRYGRAGVFVITSPESGDGKTSATSNLAIALAGIGKSVLMIDGDMRRPSLHRVFNTENSRGLIDFLHKDGEPGEGELSGLLRRTCIPNLSVLPSGKPESFDYRLLHSPRMRELISICRETHDYVLVDTPPMVNVSDARVWARAADTVVLILRAGRTRRNVAVSAYQALLEDGAPVQGVILNHWDLNRSIQYGRSYREYAAETARV